MIKGYLYSLAAVLFWSLNFLFAVELISHVSAIEINFYRWSVALVVLVPFLLPLFKKLRAHPPNKRTWLMICMTALTGITVFNTVLYFAAGSTTPVNLAIFAITSPVFVALINRFVLGIHYHLLTWLGVLVAMIGAALLISQGDIAVITTQTFSIGDLWMMFAAFLFAVYTILISKVKLPQIKPIEYLTLLTLLGLLMLLPFWLAQIGLQGRSELNTQQLGYLLYLGVFASVASFYAWNKSTLMIGSLKTGTMYYLMPILVFILGVLLFDGQPNLFVAFCCALVLCGVLLVHFTLHKAK